MGASLNSILTAWQNQTDYEHPIRPRAGDLAGMGPIRKFAKALLRRRRFDETFRAITRRRCRSLGSSRFVARHGLRTAPELGTELDRRPSVCRRRVAARQRLERRSLSRDSFPRRLLRRFSGDGIGENAPGGG